MLSLVHLIYMAGDKCMRQNACFYLEYGFISDLTVNKFFCLKVNIILFVLINRPQHLMGLQLLSDMCGGRLEGGHVGSTEITLTPKNIHGGKYTADTKTAG